MTLFRSLLSILFLLITFSSFAQEPGLVWTKNNVSGTNSKSAMAIAVDGPGNVYTVGGFLGTVDLDPTATVANYSSVGMSDTYITKLDVNGDLVWVRRIGTAGDDTPYSVSVDPSGNVLISGQIQGTYDFDQGPGVANGNSGDYILKLNSSGDYIWVGTLGLGISNTVLNTDDSGNVHATGTFFGTQDFDPTSGTSTMTSTGLADIFVLQLTPSGSLTWARNMGGTGSSFNTGSDIDVDLSGFIYVAGYFSSTIDFDPDGGIKNLTSAGDTDAFLLKLSAAGEFEWVRQFGATDGDQGKTVNVDLAGNISVGGIFKNTVDFDPGIPSAPLISDSNSIDYFIVRLTSNGNYIWAGRVGDGTDEYLNTSTADGAGNVYFSGYASTLVDLDPGAGTFFNPSAGGFISKVDATGIFQWATSINPSAGVTKLVISASDEIYLTGNFTGTRDFDPGSCVINLTSASISISDLFLEKLKVSTPPLCGPTPTITGFTPGSGPTGTLVTITGTNFSTTPSFNEVKFNGVLASASSSTTTSIDVTVPVSATTGLITVKVNGNTATSSSAFTVTATGSGFSPTSGPVGTLVTISGILFTLNADTEVRFNSMLATIVNVTSSSSVEAVVPTGATTGPVSISSSGNTAFTIIPFTVTTPPTPTITSFTPGSGLIGVPVTIIGTNFNTTPGNNEVRFNGTLATVTASTVTSIDTTVPVGATSGVITVKVGNSTATSATNFVVTLPPPTITSFNPGSGFAGNTVVITGTNFSTTQSQNTVRFNGTLASASLSTSTSITTSVPAGATTGVITVRVGTNTATSSTDFVVTLPPPPTITSFTPALGPEATSVTITGTNFSAITSSNEVRFNGTLATITSNSTTSIVTAVPSGATSGVITVTVSGNTATSATDFTVTHPPTIVSFNPTSGTVGNSVTITGTNFITTPSGNTVKFNGTVATVSSSTATTIVTEVPLNATTGPITVTVTDGTATSAIDFTIIVPFITISAQPSNATVCKGQSGSITATASGTTNLSYQWGSYESSVFTPLSNDSDYSGVNTNTLTITTSALSGTKVYRCQISGDHAASVFTDDASLTTNAIPAAPVTTNASGCLPSASVVLQASGGNDGQYRWYANATGGVAITGEVNHLFTTPAIASTINYYVSVISNGCESARAITTASVIFCNQPPSIATTSKSISVEETATIDLLDLISDADNNIDPSSFKITKPPLSGAPALITNSVLRINYSGIAFSGKDLLTIEACDIEGSCAQQELTIDVDGEVIVYNAISPNGDNKNDFLFLQYIDIIQDTKENKVTIFNRWGDIVFEINNYNNSENVFAGLNKNGNELPSGTYFYKIQFASSRKSQNGYLYLKR